MITESPNRIISDTLNVKTPDLSVYNLNRENILHDASTLEIWDYDVRDSRVGQIIFGDEVIARTTLLKVEEQPGKMIYQLVLTDISRVDVPWIISFYKNAFNCNYEYMIDPKDYGDVFMFGWNARKVDYVMLQEGYNLSPKVKLH